MCTSDSGTVHLVVFLSKVFTIELEGGRPKGKARQLLNKHSFAQQVLVHKQINNHSEVDCEPVCLCPGSTLAPKRCGHKELGALHNFQGPAAIVRPHTT